jgi:putative membrane protein
MSSLDLFRAAGIALACLVTCSASGQTPQAPAPMTDENFLRGAAQTSMAEIELGDLAFTRAENSELRTLAKALADEHRALNSDLYSVATQEGVAMPGSLDAETRLVVNGIAAKDGEEFDRAFLAWLDAAHISQANLYDAQMRQSGDADVRDFARKWADDMLTHLSRVRNLQIADSD